MAKVIEVGVFRKVHKPCKSLIEFNLSELLDGCDRDYLGDGDYYRYLICPACGDRMKFPAYGNLD